MNQIITAHPLRTIILQYHEGRVAPEWETAALTIYREMHDRFGQMEERLRVAREKIPALHFQKEAVEEVIQDVKRKFEHLQVMIPENPERGRVTMQLQMYLERLDILMGDFLPDLIDHTMDFFEYDEYTIKEDEWLNEVAFTAFRPIFAQYESCAVDMVSFDRDLDDFKGALGHIRNREGKYYELMNELTDSYTDINEAVGALHDQIDDFDERILAFMRDESADNSE